jgi:hypothetical protein
MWEEDPILAEVHAWREEMMKEAGNTIEGLFELLRRDQDKYRDRLVTLESRPAIPVGSSKIKP